MDLKTQKANQQRKFYMVLPLLVIPFLTMIFWALGGGQGTPVQAKDVKETGLNPALPGAQIKEGDIIWDKLELYQKARRDSMKLEERKRSDPYFRFSMLKSINENEQDQNPAQTPGKINPSLGKRDQAVDPNEEKVQKKLQQLYQEINKTESKPEQKLTNTPSAPTPDPRFSGDVDRLESMMEMMHEENSQDPEMEQINLMLEKILDIQHPERVKERLQENKPTEDRKAYSVTTSSTQPEIEAFGNNERTINLSDTTSIEDIVREYNQIYHNGFYGLEDEREIQSNQDNAIEAVIHETQSLVAGSTVKIRLLNDIFINGKKLVKDSFAYGTCSIKDERLTITINSIRNGNSILPVSLSVYDMDGLEGIYVPGTITRDAAKQASTQALQGIEFSTLDPSLEAQVAGAGVQAAKGLLGKKARMIKVTVKAGYKILLVDTQSKSKL